MAVTFESSNFYPSAPTELQLHEPEATEDIHTPLPEKPDHDTIVEISGPIGIREVKPFEPGFIVNTRDFLEAKFQYEKDNYTNETYSELQDNNDEVKNISVNLPVTVQIQSGLIHEDKQYCGCFERPVYSVCLFFSLGLWTSVVVYVVLYEIHDEDYYYIPLIFWIVYALEVLFCKTSRYLWNLNLVEDVVTYVKRIKMEAPAISLHCRCSHQELRTRTVMETYTDASGNLQTRSRVETYWETVVTYVGCEDIFYSRFEDCSGQVTDEVLQWNAIRIEYSKTWECGDDVTQTLVARQIDDFDRRNRSRDVNYEQWTELKIDGYKGTMLSIVDTEKRSALLRWWVYILISLLLGASWPYRLWFCRATVKGRFLFRKAIYRT